jgi:drug/metabolite transporter (DMT)-like permease
VGEFSAIVMTSPLVVTLLAQRLLGEHVSLKRVMLVIGGFIGVLLIVRPGSDAFSVYMFFPMVLVVLNAAFQLLTSKLSQTEKSLTIHFYSVWTGALLTTFLLFWGWTPVSEPLIWFELLLIGAAGAIGHATALVLAAQGANLMLVDIDGERLVQRHAAVAALGTQVELCRADCSRSEDVQAYVRQAQQALGRIDGLFNSIEGHC